jgi:5-methylthioadenosine/S-adenosylhomocysteine deaminase
MKKPFDIGIKASWVLPMDQNPTQVLTDCFVGIEKNKIVAIEPLSKNHRKLCKKWIDGQGMALIPGLINAHTHLAMTLFRGLEDDTPLKVWLFDRIFPLEAKFVSREFVKTGSELAALECIRFGTTTVADMYYHPAVTMKVWDKIGLRGLFSQPVMDFPLPEDRTLGKDHWGRFLKNLKAYRKHPRLKFALAPHAPYTCGDDVLKKVAQLSSETLCPIHIHLSEAKHEEPESQTRYKKSQVERLFELGVLGPRTICAHSVHLSESDKVLLKQSGASVVHNPDSNLKLSSGVAPVVSYLKHDINVALGTDGSASANDLSLFGAMDLATKVQKLVSQDNTAMVAAQTLWMATRGGAKALGLDDQIGSIETGKEADLVLVDFNFPHLQPVHDPISHLVYSCQGLEVDTVLCAGKILMSGKKILPLKAEPIFKRAKSYQKQMRAFVDLLIKKEKNPS